MFSAVKQIPQDVDIYSCVSVVSLYLERATPAPTTNSAEHRTSA